MRINRIGCTLCLSGLLVASHAAAALAQDEPPAGSMPSASPHAIKNNDMVNMHGMHTMAATVTHADPKTGIVDVMTEGMALRVHFPPAAMTNLKAGDKIGLYMAYSQASVVK